MTTLTPFDFSGQQVRVIEIDGEPWFVAGDVARVLGYSETAAMTRTLDDDEKGLHIVQTPGGEQNVTVISESGLYSAILRSRVERAKEFKRWVTREVLPTIRKTGTYSTTPALTEDEIVHQALQITARKVEQLEAKVAELEPKADLADNYLTAKPNGRLLREVAKAFGMRERDLRFESREIVVNHSWGTCQHYTLYITPQGVGLIRKRIADRKAAVIGAQS